jgi:Ni/Co efflux regulator RcnB
MKRPLTLALIATLLVSAPAFAAKDLQSKVADRVEKAARQENGNRGHDNRGNNNRGNEHRGGNTQRNNNERDRGNHAPPSYSGGGHDRRDDRNDHRNDDNRRDWNDHRNDNRNDRRSDNNRHDWNNNNRNDHRNDNRGWDRHRNDWSNHPNYWDNRRQDRRDYARYRYHFGSYRAPYGYHYRTWHRGDYLPRAYYGSSYIVHNWRPYRLYAPPYGYHWVRVGNDVLLTALATGVVLDVLYGIWY